MKDYDYKDMNRRMKESRPHAAAHTGRVCKRQSRYGDCGSDGLPGQDKRIYGSSATPRP